MKIDRPEPFKANACLMPEPSPRKEAHIYRSFRNLIIKAHCAEKREPHKCCGKITIERDTITFQCPRCGDSRAIITESANASSQ